MSDIENRLRIEDIQYNGCCFNDKSSGYNLERKIVLYLSLIYWIFIKWTYNKFTNLKTKASSQGEIM